jgi:hypothetical protein
LANFCAVVTKRSGFYFFQCQFEKITKELENLPTSIQSQKFGGKKNHPSLPMEQVFLSIFCDVATLVILHKRN